MSPPLCEREDAGEREGTYVFETLALVVLEQAVIAAEVAVAEAAVADDALGGAGAALGRAPDLLGRHFFRFLERGGRRCGSSCPLVVHSFLPVSGTLDLVFVLGVVKSLERAAATELWFDICWVCGVESAIWWRATNKSASNARGPKANTRVDGEW